MYELEIMNEIVRRFKHPNYPLYLYKYTQKCTFDRQWTPLTIKARGLILDENHKVIANCIPKFFNIEEHSQELIPKINLNQPFTATIKDDGSLIQVFMYEGTMVVSSSGGFENDYTRKAEQLLNTKYQHLLPIIQTTKGMNFIFEMIAPLTTVVVNYGDLEELRLITIRDLDGNEPGEFIQQCKDLGFDYVKEQKFESLEQLMKEKSSEFKNIEGYVLKFEDGSRVKIKYDEYFILHKNVTHATKKRVWDALSQGIELDLTNLPDEAFDSIKQWTEELNDEFTQLHYKVNEAFNDLLIEEYALNKSGIKTNRKWQAKYIMDNNKAYSGMLFAMLDKKPIVDMIWKQIKPMEN